MCSSDLSQTEEKPKPGNKKSTPRTSKKTKAKKTKPKISKVPKELVAEKTMVKEEPAKLQPKKELTKTAVPSKDKEKVASATSQIIDNTIRVDVKKLDDLLNIVSELVLGRNRLSQINLGISFEYEGNKLARDLAETTQQIDLMTTELQLAVMKTRMIKIGKVFNRFRSEEHTSELQSH